MVAATHDQIIEIVGRINDARIAEIIGTGATQTEVTEAFAWLTEDEYLGGELEKPLAGVVQRIYDILRADEPDWDEDAPRG